MNNKRLPHLMMEIKRKTTKPWQLKDWKDKRKQIIGTKCVQCGSMKPPLVVQHTWHPPAYPDLFRNVMIEYLDKLISEGKEKSREEIVEPYKDKYLVECCPGCELQTIYKRKSMNPIWRCTNCGIVFNIPGRIFYRGHPAIKKIISDYMKGLYQKYKNEIKKETQRISDENRNRYLSMIDSVTYCQKCAYLADVHNKKLCQICKKNYHSAKFKCCKDCFMRAFNEAQDKANIGGKSEKCNDCFWHFANPDTWSDFNGTPIKMIEVKARKCIECKQGKDNFSQIWKCKKCNVPIDGHNNLLHGGLCDNCF